MASKKQTQYILDLLNGKSELFASTGVVTMPMVHARLATRREMNTPLATWVRSLDKSDASWVIGKLTENRSNAS